MGSPNCRNPAAGNRGTELFAVNTGGQNAWGVWGYLGNAQEWVSVAPGEHIARGGAYKDGLANCTVEFSRSHPGTADEITGFRLMRELGEGA